MMMRPRQISSFVFNMSFGWKIQRMAHRGHWWSLHQYAMSSFGIFERNSRFHCAKEHHRSIHWTGFIESAFLISLIDRFRLSGQSLSLVYQQWQSHNEGFPENSYGNRRRLFPDQTMSSTALSSHRLHPNHQCQVLHTKCSKQTWWFPQCTMSLRIFSSSNGQWSQVKENGIVNGRKVLWNVENGVNTRRHPSARITRRFFASQR